VLASRNREISLDNIGSMSYNFEMPCISCMSFERHTSYTLSVLSRLLFDVAKRDRITFSHFVFSISRRSEVR
jgi:hypothetical protein